MKYNSIAKKYLSPPRVKTEITNLKNVLFNDMGVLHRLSAVQANVLINVKKSCTITRYNNREDNKKQLRKKKAEK